MASQAIEQRERTIPQSQIKDMGFDSGPSFALLRTAAEFLSKSDIIPKQYQGNIANCAVALNMAKRMGADPVMVMQNLYPIYGRPSWSAQFLIATINTKGEFSKLRYEWSDEKDKTKDGYGCRAYAVELATGETLYGPWVTVGLARAEGWYSRKDRDGKVASKWPTLTETMCMYRAASFFVRAYCPEITMGLRTQDEEEDLQGVRNVTREGQVVEKTANMPPAYSGPVSDPGPAPEPEQAEQPPSPVPPTENPESDPDDERPVTTVQAKNVQKIASKAGYTEALLKKLLQACGYSSPAEIRQKHYLTICEAIEGTPFDQVSQTIEYLGKWCREN